MPSLLIIGGHYFFHFICIFRVSLSTFVKRNSYRSVVKKNIFVSKKKKKNHKKSRIYSKYSFQKLKKAFLKYNKNGKVYNIYICILQKCEQKENVIVNEANNCLVEMLGACVRVNLKKMEYVEKRYIMIWKWRQQNSCLNKKHFLEWNNTNKVIIKIHFIVFITSLFIFEKEK